MRIAFVETLSELARAHDNLMLLTGDLGFGVFENFRKEFPDRFLNAGVQESNMMGMAAGMALAGKTVFVYSIIPFATMRCFEFIRNDVCAHNANVKIVGVGQGYSYSIYGHTHHAIEDVGALRSLPNLKIIAPGDPLEARAATQAIAETDGPFYLRLGKRGEPNIHEKPPLFEIGKGIVVHDGADVALFVSGGMLEHAAQARQMLAERGVSAALISMPTIKPIDANLIREYASRVRVILAIEEHNVIGGLGSAVAEVLAESPHHPQFKRMGVPDVFGVRIGSQEYMRNQMGISKEHIVETALALLGDNKPKTQSPATNEHNLYSTNPPLPLGERVGVRGPTDKKISVVVVCYFDELNIRALYHRLTNVLRATAPDYEIIYVNDASPDNAESVLRELAAQDPRLTVINHARNFGGQIAFTSGMRQATGDAVILMDGDLQDPPELIPEFIQQWQAGHQVVYGVRRQREASMGAFKQWLYHMFYVTFSKLAYVRVPLDAGEFSLMARVVVDHVNAMPERDRFIRGLRAWVGYKSVGIPYVRPERYDGRASVSTRGLISAFRWARKAIFSFSYKPLEWITHLAFAAMGVAVLGIIYYTISFFVADAPRGFSTLIVVVLFFAAVQLLSVSFIGEYVGRIFEETKQRPQYIIRDIINDHRNPPAESA
ncbi:MAG: glycosyltransferase [Patescibacteria group bacterium]